MARERDRQTWRNQGRRWRRHEGWEDSQEPDTHEDYEQGLGGSGQERHHGHTRFGQDFYDPSDYGREYGGHDSRGREYGGQEAWMHEGEHSGRGPKGYARSDERIAEEVNERLTRHGQVDASDIEVSVENGEVTLTGTVDSRRAKRLAEDAIETVWGVKDVHNRLTIGRQPAKNVGSRTDQKQS